MGCIGFTLFQTFKCITPVLIMIGFTMGIETSFVKGFTGNPFPVPALAAKGIFFLDFQKRKVPVKVCKQVKRTDNIAIGLVVEKYRHNNQNSKKTEKKVECIFLVCSDREYVIY